MQGGSIVQTYYSSFILGAVSLFASLKRHWLGIPFLIIYGTSILYHAKYNDVYSGQNVVFIIDKTLAQFIVLATICMALRLKNTMILPMFVYWSGLGWLVYVYYIGKHSHLPCRKWIPWHVSIHIVASIGTICLLSHY